MHSAPSTQHKTQLVLVSTSDRVDTDRKSRRVLERHHVHKGRKILLRLARFRRCAPPEIIHFEAGGAPIRIRTKGTCAPKIEGAEQTIAHILSARFKANSTNDQAAHLLIAAAGKIPPRKLSIAHTLEIDEAIARGPYQHSTRCVKSSAVRHLLRWLWEAYGAPKLDEHIRHYTGVRPRNVTATREEIDALLNNALPGLKLWILLCSDLAIRSGTASKLSRRNYSTEDQMLRFTTKHSARLTLPVTAEIRELIEQCDPSSDEPFVRQLWQRTRPRQARPLGVSFDNGGKLRIHFKALCKAVGIERRITPPRLTTHNSRRHARIHKRRARRPNPSGTPEPASYPLVSRS